LVPETLVMLTNFVYPIQLEKTKKTTLWVEVVFSVFEKSLMNGALQLLE
jgi:hypothetical protein